VKQKGRKLLLVPFLAFALFLMALAGPLNASAASVGNPHLTQTKQHITKSAVQPNANLLFHSGGSVMAGTAHFFAIFWEPSGSFVSATYNSLILRFLGDLGGSTLYHNDTQYTGVNGTIVNASSSVSSFVDTAAYPSNPISDAQVQAEVTHAQAVNGWSSSIDNIFLVFTAKNESVCIDPSTCSFTTFCGYHNLFGTNTIYSSLPYTGTNLAGCGTPVSPNHDFDADSTINVTSHEINEAATDPLLNAWFDSSGNEIGDKCNFNFGPTLPSGGDVVFNTHPYEVQREWDNHARGCVLAGP
jgi:hypothetical protein